MSGTILYGVGATKAGTSWLYRALHTHPDCALKAVKELHYWDTFDAETRGRQVAALQARLSGYQAQRADAVAAERGWQVANMDRRIADLDALLTVLAADRTGDAAYLRYLAPGAALVADMTPGYSVLDTATFARMAATAPRALFVFLIRDPFARLWSHVRMQAERQRQPHETFDEKANNILWRILHRGQETHVLARGDYPNTVDRLRAAVPGDRLRIEYCERMFTPDGFAELCRWLGIAPRAADGGDVAHEGPKAQVKPELRAKAVRFLRDHYDWAAREVGPLPQAWQDNLAKGAA